MATPSSKDDKNQPQITQGGGQKKRDQFWTVVVIAVVVLILGVIVRVKYLNEKRTAPAPTGQISTLQSRQEILKLVPGGSIQWVSIPRGMCYEINLAKDGECITSFGNSEEYPRPMCQGVSTRRSGPVFQIGLQSDHLTTAAVDLFPCN